MFVLVERSRRWCLKFEVLKLCKDLMILRFVIQDCSCPHSAYYSSRNKSAMNRRHACPGLDPVSCCANTLVLDNRGRSIDSLALQISAIFSCLFAQVLRKLANILHLVSRGSQVLRPYLASGGPRWGCVRRGRSVLLSRLAGIGRTALLAGVAGFVCLVIGFSGGSHCEKSARVEVVWNDGEDPLSTRRDFRAQTPSPAPTLTGRRNPKNCTTRWPLALSRLLTTWRARRQLSPTASSKTFGRRVKDEVSPESHLLRRDVKHI